MDAVRLRVEAINNADYHLNFRIFEILEKQFGSFQLGSMNPRIIIRILQEYGLIYFLK